MKELLVGLAVLIGASAGIAAGRKLRRKFQESTATTEVFDDHVMDDLRRIGEEFQTNMAAEEMASGNVTVH